MPVTVNIRAGFGRGHDARDVSARTGKGGILGPGSLNVARVEMQQ